MIAADHLKRIAAWARDLNEKEIEVARAGIVEKSFKANEFVCMRGDQFEYWTGVVSGLAKIGTISRSGKEVSITGLTAGAWFGEGSVLKNEPRRYDIVPLRDSKLAFMERPAFMWLFENSVGFNRFLVSLLNERLGQFIALTEYGRRLDLPGGSRAALPRCSTRSSIATRPAIWTSPRKSSVPSAAFRGRGRTSACRRWRRRVCCGSNMAA